MIRVHPLSKPPPSPLPGRSGCLSDETPILACQESLDQTQLRTVNYPMTTGSERWRRVQYCGRGQHKASLPATHITMLGDSALASRIRTIHSS